MPAREFGLRGRATRQSIARFGCGYCAVAGFGLAGVPKMEQLFDYFKLRDLSRDTFSERILDDDLDHVFAWCEC